MPSWSWYGRTRGACGGVARPMQPPALDCTHALAGRDRGPLPWPRCVIREDRIIVLGDQHADPPGIADLVYFRVMRPTRIVEQRNQLGLHVRTIRGDAAKGQPAHRVVARRLTHRVEIVVDVGPMSRIRLQHRLSRQHPVEPFVDLARVEGAAPRFGIVREPGQLRYYV